jgi:hypothetical protein
MIEQVDDEMRDAILNEMREMIDRGTDVRGLTEFLQQRLELKSDSAIPVMAYFCRAFYLQLYDILPIREWLGSDKDREVNELIMPKILKERPKWPQPSLKT